MPRPPTDHATALKVRGFKPFHGDGWVSYETKKPVNEGGIRVVIAGDVAEIWCVSPKYWDVVPASQVVQVVDDLDPGGRIAFAP